MQGQRTREQQNSHDWLIAAPRQGTTPEEVEEKEIPSDSASRQDMAIKPWVWAGSHLWGGKAYKQLRA